MSFVNGAWICDFTVQDSFRYLATQGRKELESGLFATYAGDMDRPYLPSYDINSSDEIVGAQHNGLFDSFLAGDVNLDGEVSGLDRQVWGATAMCIRAYPSKVTCAGRIPTCQTVVRSTRDDSSIRLNVEAY